MERSAASRPATTLLAVAVTLLWASPAIASVDAAGARAPQPLVIGSLAPETGPLAPLLDSLRTPVAMAVDEISAAGGVGGQPVTLVSADEGTDATSARSGFAALLDGGAQVVVGPASSSATEAILGEARDGALVCSGSNSAEALSSAGPRRSGGRYFRTAPPDRFQGPALAELIASANHRRVAVLARRGADGDEIAGPLVAALRRRGVEVPATVRYDPDATDLTRPVERALATRPDAVAVVAELDDGARVLQALREADASPATLPTYGAAPLSSGSLADLVDPLHPDALTGLAGIAPAVAPAGVTHPFLDAFTATGLDPVFSAHQYDCTILAALAAVRAGSTDPGKMAAVFAENLHGSRDCDTFASCAELLDAGKSIHYRGASSRFDRFGAFQPREGVYQPWTYDAAGAPRDTDPSTQITTP